MTTPTAAGRDEQDIAALSSIPTLMIEAWNRGDGPGFAAPFTDNADFVAFEGTHLSGRAQIAEFHQYLFDTAMKGSRLVGEVRFVRRLAADWAIIHARGSTIPAGAEASTESRDSMQPFLARRVDGQWKIEAVQNSRQLALQRQDFLDGIDALSPASRRRLTELVVSSGAPG